MSERLDGELHRAFAGFGLITTRGGFVVIVGGAVAVVLALLCLHSVSQVAALASLTPPVGQNRTFGNGPPSARRPLMPPACSAGEGDRVG